uniref:Uncharacterized protein n=1 Tax=Panthera leo TaxID=9689 RepID=A0A8C8Y8U3_PANLE
MLGESGCFIRTYLNRETFNIKNKKIAQLEEVKQTSNKQIQNTNDMQKSQQALVQKRCCLFDGHVFHPPCAVF